MRFLRFLICLCCLFTSILAQKWHTIDSLSIPVGSSESVCQRYDNKLYIFGGRKADGTYQSDTLHFDFDNFKWHNISSLASPAPFTGYQAYFIDPILWFLGPRVPSYSHLQHSGTGLLWYFNFSNLEWYTFENKTMIPSLTRRLCAVSNKNDKIWGICGEYMGIQSMVLKMIIF